jgi:transcriptional regulator with XRE-family HTH domain
VSTIGENLRRFREAAGLSQAQLAERAGLSVRSIQNWEQGQRTPRAALLLPLAQALDVGLAQLLSSGKGTAK